MLAYGIWNKIHPVSTVWYRERKGGNETYGHVEKGKDSLIGGFVEKKKLVSCSQNSSVQQEHVSDCQHTAIPCVYREARERPGELSLASTKPNLAGACSETWLSLLGTCAWRCEALCLCLLYVE
jgi:hypothetical protein